MPRRLADRKLARILRLAARTLEERATAEDQEQLALLLLELDDDIVLAAERPPKRWTWRSD